MSLRLFLFIIGCGTLAVFIAWIYVLFAINPAETNLIGFLFFYATLGGSCLGISTLIGICLRRIFWRTGLVSRQVMESFRQGVFLSLLFLLSLFLLSLHVLTWWTILLLVLFLSLLELAFFVTYKKSN